MQTMGQERWQRPVGVGAKKNIHFLRGVCYNEMSVSMGQVFAGKDIRNYGRENDNGNHERQT